MSFFVSLCQIACRIWIFLKKYHCHPFPYFPSNCIQLVPLTKHFAAKIMKRQHNHTCLYFWNARLVFSPSLASFLVSSVAFFLSYSKCHHFRIEVNVNLGQLCPLFLPDIIQPMCPNEISTNRHFSIICECCRANSKEYRYLPIHSLQ